MKKCIVIFLLSFSILLLTPRLIFAAELFFEQEKNHKSGDLFVAHVLINTEEVLNAVAGTIVFPSELLELKEIKDGNSIINFWLERPTVGKAGEIVFSGITPGGYTGAKRLIFSMSFRIQRGGEGVFKVRDARVLRNDGEGTEAELKIFDFPFAVSQKEPAAETAAGEAKDHGSPETFTPDIGKDPVLFDGRWFVVFTTRDKNSGMDHYEVKESRQRIATFFQTWSRADSPYVLQDQELRSFIFVKAVDKAGNERIVKINPHNPLSWYADYETWIIIMAVVILVFYTAKKLWRKERAQ